MNAIKVPAENPMSFVAIHTRAMAAAKNYHRCEAELIEAIADVESRQLYYQVQIKDLYDYCSEMLNLSRDAAYNFIAVMKKSAEVPAMLEAIREGKVTVSKARKLCSVINERNSKEWLELAQYRSCRIVERAVAMANPRAAVIESMKYVSGDVLEFKMAISEEWSGLLTEIKDLMSQKSKRAVSTEEALFELMTDYKRKNDPVLKANRQAARKVKTKSSAEAKPSINSMILSDESLKDERDQFSLAVESEPSILDSDTYSNREAFENSPPSVGLRRRYIPAATRHVTALRDNGKCTFVDRHGKRCGSGRFVQRHHIQHFSDGGSHAPENLETLCWAHHAMKHRDDSK